jgi:hypothetical protein
VTHNSFIVKKYLIGELGMAIKEHTSIELEHQHFSLSRPATVRQLARNANVSTRTAYRYWHEIGAWKTDTPVMMFLPPTYGSGVKKNV